MRGLNTPPRPAIRNPPTSMTLPPISPSGKSVARLSNTVSVSASLLPRIQCTSQPSGEQRRQHLPQRHAQFAVAEQDQRARLLRGAGAQDRREIAVRVAGDDDPARAVVIARARVDHSARPKPSRRAAAPIVQPWMTSDTTTTTNTPENNLCIAAGIGQGGNDAHIDRAPRRAARPRTQTPIHASAKRNGSRQAKTATGRATTISTIAMTTGRPG